MASPMTEQRLNMILAADDQASEVITAVIEQIAELADGATAMSEKVSTAFADIGDAIDLMVESLDAAQESAQEFGAVMERVFGAAGAEAEQSMQAAAAATETAMETAAEAATTAGDGIGAAMDAASAQMVAFGEKSQAAVAAAMEEATAAVARFSATAMLTLDGAATALSTSFSEATTAVGADLDALQAQLGALTTEATQAGAGMSAGAGGGVAGAKGGKAGHGSSFSLLGAGMTAWMGMMGMQMLAQSAMGPSQLLALMGQTNASPGAAERFAGMMGAGGIGLSSLPSFLSGFEAKMQNISTVVGSSGFPKESLLAMQNMGYTGSNPFEQIASLHSPIQQIDAIMKVYGQLQGKGMGSQGAAMLSQLGLGQLAPIAGQWGTLQQSFAGFNLGMNKSQLQQHATSGVTMNAALLKLQMTLSMLATALAPLATRLISAVTGMVDALSGAGGGGSGIGKALAAVATGLAAIEAVKFGRAIFDTIVTTINTARTTIQATSAAFAAGMERDGAEIAGAEATAEQTAAVAAGGSLVESLLLWGARLSGALIGYAAGFAEAIGAFLGEAATAMAPLLVAFGPWALVIAAGVALVVLAITHWRQITAAVHSAYSAVVGAARTFVGGVQHWLQLHPVVAKVASVVWAALSPFTFALTHWTQVKSIADKAAAAIAGAASSLFAALEALITQIVGALQRFLSGLVASISSMVRNALGSVGGLLGDLTGGGSKGSPLTGSAAAAAAAGKPLGASTIASIAQYAEQKAGVASKWGSTGLQDLVWMAQKESGGVATALNPKGVNYGAGHGVEHAQGLMQLMPTTFSASKMASGMGSILDPVANMLASVQYIVGRYGSPQNIPGIGTGAYTGYASGGIISEPISGVGASGRRYMFGEAGAEAVVPLGGGRGGIGGHRSALDLTVTVNSSGPLNRQAAQQVAQEIVNQLKLRAKFDASPA